MIGGYGVGKGGTGGGGGSNLQNGSGTTDGGGTYAIPAGATVVQFWLDGVLKEEGDGWNQVGDTIEISPDISDVFYSYNYTT